MRFSRITSVLLFCLALSLLLVAQSAERDSESVSMLQKAVVAAGGKDSINSVKDFVAMGTITYYWNGSEVSGPVEVRGRGSDQVRMDAHMSDGVHSMVLNRGKGKVVDATSIHGISSANAANLGLLVYPLPSIVVAIDDLKTGVSSGGKAEIEGISVDKVRVVHGLSPQFDRVGSLRAMRTVEVFIDPATSMIAAIKYPYFSERPSGPNHVREVDFSNFKSVKGVIMPFTITEKAADQLMSTIRLDSVNFNTGVPSNIFE